MLRFQPGFCHGAHRLGNLAVPGFAVKG